MEFNFLSTTDIKVSKACLWTMNFWKHVNENESFKIMDKALELWINFFDTAEVYAIPPSEETYWTTETIIWKWMKDRNSRNKIILATKISGPQRWWRTPYLRWWDNHFDKKNIFEAIEWSLKRLWTDYVDLYQLHWPDRNLNIFWDRNYFHKKDEISIPIEETLEALNEIKKKWYVREFWLSNESPWWTMKFLQIAKEKNLPRMVSVQNNYSLLTRTFDTWMSEVSLRENIWLLAYSPLWYWVLWWNYLNWNKPANWRFTKFPFFASRYISKEVEIIIPKYKNLAEENWLTLSQMALAFVYWRDFLTSNIIGPANIEQLLDCVKVLEIKLDKKIIKSINDINEEHPSPCA